MGENLGVPAFDIFYLYIYLMLLLLLRRAPRAQEGGPSERQHLLGVGRDNSNWGRGAAKGVLPENIEI